LMTPSRSSRLTQSGERRTMPLSPAASQIDTFIRCSAVSGPTCSSNAPASFIARSSPENRRRDDGCQQSRSLKGHPGPSRSRPGSGPAISA
jgi:hypothetical protein